MARMKSAQTVYYGPAYSGYPSVGSVSANESVDFLWTEGAWCYIRYSVSGTANKKCGYVPETAVNHANKSLLTRSRQAYSKQVCLWDLAQIICIAFIIQVAWAI